MHTEEAPQTQRRTERGEWLSYIHGDRTERHAARPRCSTGPSLPDRAPPVARCLPEELLLLPEDDRLLPPFRRKDSTCAATTGLVTGNLAWGVMYCSERPIGGGGGETPQLYPRSLFGIPCVGTGDDLSRKGLYFHNFSGGGFQEYTGSEHAHVYRCRYGIQVPTCLVRRNFTCQMGKRNGRLACTYALPSLSARVPERFQGFASVNYRLHT